MVKITFNEPDDEKWKKWRRDCEEGTNKLIDSVNAGNKPEITDLYKRESIKKEIYFNKQGPFHGKCAYCECYITNFQRGDIEHFRPKLAVTDKNDNPIQHPGYYWLAYDWQNLLPSCQICNQPSKIGDKKIGKHNRFPVNGNHARTPAEVKDEKPLLIHH
ncbi:MAG TPA: hypothetical protein VJL89_13515 [Thermodesulfovibrionia bacterium]|nr:hypothetical protein [Thermodesulfovibrionia bacterium]